MQPHHHSSVSTGAARSDGQGSNEEGPPGSIRPPVRGGETILVVEDDARVLRVIQRALRPLVRHTLVSASPLDALEATREIRRLDLLLTDVVLPQMSGLRLASCMRGRWPELRVLYMSGYSDMELMQYGITRAQANFIPKPFTLELFARRVRDALGS